MAKTEMTQIMALNEVINENVERDPEVTAKLVEVYNALVKKKENRKPKKVAEADVIQFEYLAADALCLNRELWLMVVEACVCFGFQFVEGINACLRLGATSLRHATHPF